MSEISSSSHCITNKEKYINDTSDDAEDFEDTIQLNNKKIRKEGKKYDQYCSFRTLESAMNHLKGKYCRDTCNQYCIFCLSWKSNKISSTRIGDKYRYVCSFKDCKTTIQLTHFPTQITLLEISTDEHNHVNVNGIINKNKGVPEASKPRIQELEKLGVKASRMLDLLREENLQRPQLRQLNNYLAQLRKNKNGPVRMSLNELKTWSENRNEIPDNFDQVFVAAFEYNLQPRKFRMFLTTKRLIQNSVHQQNCVSDATYKLIFEEYPVFTVGNIDKDKHFHPFGLGIASNEEETDFGFIFSSVKNAAKKINNNIYMPEILIADDAGAITNGFRSNFDLKKVNNFFICFFLFLSIKLINFIN